MSDHQDQPSSPGQPSGYEEGRQEGQAGEKGLRDKAGKPRGEEPNPPPQHTHSPLPRTGPQPGANRARHGAKRARQREGVSPRLRNSTPGQGARATRRPSRAARTTTQNTTRPRQTAAPDDKRAAKNKSKPRSPHSATAAVRMDVCAPGRVPNPCRLRNSRRPDGRVCARQWTQPLLATNQPPSGWPCVRPAVNPAPAGYETAAVRMDVCAPGSEPSPCRLQNSRRPDGRVCARQ